jgi:hypothetical protein
MTIHPPIPKHNTARQAGDAFPAPPNHPSQLARPLRLPPHQSPCSGPHVPAGVLPPPGAFRSRRRQIPRPPQGCRRLRQPASQGNRLGCARASVHGWSTRPPPRRTHLMTATGDGGGQLGLDWRRAAKYAEASTGMERVRGSQHQNIPTKPRWSRQTPRWSRWLPHGATVCPTNLLHRGAPLAP